MFAFLTPPVTSLIFLFSNHPFSFHLLYLPFRGRSFFFYPLASFLTLPVTSLILFICNHSFSFYYIYHVFHFVVVSFPPTASFVFSFLILPVTALTSLPCNFHYLFFFPRYFMLFNFLLKFSPILHFLSFVLCVPIFLGGQ